MNHGPVTSRPTSASPPPTAAAPRQAGGDDVDPLLHTDDQTLEELLADLDADQPWLDVVAAEEEERQRTEAEEHRRVLSLLDELGKEGPSTHPTPGRDDTTGSGAGGENSSDDDDDDSEGDAMAHETDNVLAQAVDEADWDKANKPPSPSPPPSPPPPARGTDSSSSSSLPGHDRATDAGPFVDLPAAPTALQGQPDVVKEGSEEDDEDDADFAATIVARMAALQVSPARSLPSAPTADPDELSLPAAPSFAPADRPPAFVSSSRRAAGYTDADQLTWCVVCLEDGTVRCLGCSSSDGGGGGGGGDVYCARCWREMHVGPAAGYDERGHRWEKFVGGGRGAAR
ncbi:hypothetical protein GGR56DRAFT_649091 [Xylariaceae sp. FL0804]|nr:hypothetical protein GGR56DRAFT_649091 [Xylariaceae sp. FL0804]